jgi:lysozyme
MDKLTLEQKLSALHVKAYIVAFNWYLRRGVVPSQLKQIMKATLSVRSFLEYQNLGIKDDKERRRVPTGVSDGGEYWPGGGDKHPNADSDAQENPQPAKRLSISESGVNFIKKREQYRSIVYSDQAGKPTIGYGHELKPGEIYPDGITREQAERLLVQDIGKAEKVIQNDVKVDLVQHQFDALTSLVYNIGGYNFVNSTLLQMLNRSDYDSAADQFLEWNKITQNGEKYPVPV